MSDEPKRVRYEVKSPGGVVLDRRLFVDLAVGDTVHITCTPAIHPSLVGVATLTGLRFIDPDSDEN